MNALILTPSYNLSEIFQNAWAMVREKGETFSQSLRAAWAAAKEAVRKLSIDLTKIGELTLIELKDLRAAIDATIAEKETPVAPEKPALVLFNPEQHFERYNGGWCKTVTGLDKSHTNGFSIQGDFVEKGRKSWFKVGAVYLDCGMAGSRKHPRKEYKLFTVDADANPVILQEESGNDWATNLWDAIEKYA